MSSEYSRIPEYNLQSSDASLALIRQWCESVDWDKGGGMLPAIVQDISTRQVLMQGFMNPQALERSLEDGKVTFYSRSKQRLWCKGETSGNFLLIRELALDCDRDSLLILAQPCGPTCHTGSHSCYGSPLPQLFKAAPPSELHTERAAKGDGELPTGEAGLEQLGQETAAIQSLGVGWLGALERVVQQRAEQTGTTPKSYVRQLLERGLQRIAQKVGEEGVEVALAAMALQMAPSEQAGRAALAAETADLLFHLIVLLQACSMSLQDAIDLLEQRHHRPPRPKALKTAASSQ